MAYVLCKALDRLRADYNTLSPGRDKASDGWVGDLTHQTYPSGHNPDESGLPERYDSDSKDEVRAIDVDKDLRHPAGITMQQTVDKILATERDRQRLIYIIFNGYIWEKSNGWAKRTYTGSNPHDKHAHFSGDPAYDEDDSQWCVATMGDTVSEAEVLAGLDEIRQLQHTGIRDRLGDDWLLSQRTAVEYCFEFTRNAKPLLDQILAAVLNVDEEVLRQIGDVIDPAQQARMVSALLYNNPVRVGALASALAEMVPELQEQAQALRAELTERQRALDERRTLAIEQSHPAPDGV